MPSTSCCKILICQAVSRWQSQRTGRLGPEKKRKEKKRKRILSHLRGSAPVASPKVWPIVVIFERPLNVGGRRGVGSELMQVPFCGVSGVAATARAWVPAACLCNSSLTTFLGESL